MSCDESIPTSADTRPEGEKPASIGLSWGGDLRMLVALAVPNVATTVAQTLMSFTDFVIVFKRQCVLDIAQ